MEDINNYDGILISPGPGIPDEAGMTKDVIKKYYKEKNILGICLGQQAIAEVFGGEIENMRRSIPRSCNQNKLQKNMMKSLMIFLDSFDVGRYHSWIVKSPLPDDLIITSELIITNQIMSLKHI